MDSESLENPDQEYSLPAGSTAWLRKFTWEESARAIGRICMVFQELEESVSGHISALIGEDLHLGTIITAELSFRSKVGLLSSLYLYRANLGEIPHEFRSLLARLHTAEQRRNTILHSYWGRSPDNTKSLTRYKYTAKTSRGLIHHIEQLHHEDIDAIASEIGSVNIDLFDHMASVFPGVKERASTS